MNRKNIGNAANEQNPNLNHDDSIRDFVAANGTFVASTPPTGAAGHPLNHPQHSTPIEYSASNITHPTVNNGKMRTKHHKPTVNNGTMRTKHYHNPMTSHFSTPSIPSTPGHNMQPYNPQSYPDAQNPPFVQHQTHFHNVGFVVSSPQAGVPPNTAPRMRPQLQMFENPHPNTGAKRTLRSANASFVAQPPQAPQQAQPVIPQQAQPMAPQQAQPMAPQQAQPVAPPMSMQATERHVEQLLDEEGLNFGTYIRNAADCARYKEAKRRLALDSTPELARDIPTTEDAQLPLMRRIFFALGHWKTDDHPGASKMAINNLKSQTSLDYMIVSRDLLVFEPEHLVTLAIS